MKKAVLINDTSNEYHIGSKQVITNIKNLCKNNGISIFKSFTRRSISNNKLAVLNKAINDTDLIIINGEGSLHHHPRRNTKWFTTLMNIIPKDKKTVLINTLWQEMNKMEHLQDYLDKIDLISVRESASYKDILSIYNHPDKIIITPDIVFATSYTKQRIGYGDSVHRVIRQTLKKRKNYFPMSSIEQGYYHDIKSLNTPSLDCYLSWLKSLDLYVTGRFHGVCLAIMAHVPFLAFTSNSHKIEGILKDINCPDLIIKDIKDINKENKGLAIQSLQKIIKYVDLAPGKISMLFKRISQL